MEDRTYIFFNPVPVHVCPANSDAVKTGVTSDTYHQAGDLRERFELGLSAAPEETMVSTLR